MSQQVFSQEGSSTEKFMNVGEAWQLYDTELIGGWWSSVTPNTGYFQAYATWGSQSEHYFFNVRNRSSGIPYNNQDARDQLPYVMYIYSIGVAWFSPSTSCYVSNPAGVPTGEESFVNTLWKTEIPRHCSVVLRTNQDERLLTNAMMVPSGYGPVFQGVAAGDPNTTWGNLSLSHHAYTTGQSMLVNTWGFPDPLAIPRTANMSVVIRLNTYCQRLLAQFTGPNIQPMRYVTNDGSYYPSKPAAGVQVFVRGRREVQQRGDYHA